MPEFEIEFSLSAKRYRISADSLEQAIIDAEAEMHHDIAYASADCMVREIR